MDNAVKMFLKKILHSTALIKIYFFAFKHFPSKTLYFVLFYRADHDDQDVLMFNRIMLPSYYGLLRMCCIQSRSFTRQLASHQNINWAFTNIAPYPTKYAAVSTGKNF